VDPYPGAGIDRRSLAGREFGGDESGGGQLAAPAEFVRRLNRLLLAGS
jgi:hypothetical protein